MSFWASERVLLHNKIIDPRKDLVKSSWGFEKEIFFEQQSKFVDICGWDPYAVMVKQDYQTSPFAFIK